MKRCGIILRTVRSFPIHYFLMGALSTPTAHCKWATIKVYLGYLDGVGDRIDQQRDLFVHVNG